MKSCIKCGFARKSKIYTKSESYECVMCFKNKKIIQYPIINAYKCSFYLYNKNWKRNRVVIFDTVKNMTNVNSDLLVKNAFNEYNKNKLGLEESNLIDLSNYKERRKYNDKK